MASIVLRHFGGMAPSANPKSLPEGAATFVQNLDLRFGDFRPLPQPAVIGTATAGATLYKLEGAAGFVTRPGTVNFVRGPIPNDATERTYYSGDGAPKVIDLSGEVRQLGVPQPAAAPVATLVATPQFSADDAKTARLSKQSEFIRTVWENVDKPYMGLSLTDLGARFVADSADLPFSSLLKIPGAMSGQSFIPTNPAHSNLNDLRLGYRLATANGVTAAYVSLSVRSPGMAINGSLAAALVTVRHPDGTQLISNPQIEAVVESLQEAIKVADQARDAAIVRMKPLAQTFLAIADTGNPGAAATKGEAASYYGSQATDAKVNGAVTQAVASIFSAMFGYGGNNTSPLPVTGTPSPYYQDER